MPYWFRMLAWSLNAIVIVCIIGGIWLFRASQKVPDFYESKLDISQEKLETAGNELEAKLIDLNNQVQDTDAWRAEFSDEQINGWLAVDMPKQVPNFRSSGVSNPRVAVTDGRLLMACQVQTERIAAVASIDVSVFMTSEPNEIAIRINKTRLGSVPGMTSVVVNQIRDVAAKNRIPLKWSHQEGDPVAMFTIPDEIDDIGQVAVESVELIDGKIVVHGRTFEFEDSI